jgi:hypothetical protein
MVARVRTNKIFNGKVYAKNRPNSCVTDVVNNLEFDLRLGYHDLNCDVRQDALGRFSTDIIIQVSCVLKTATYFPSLLNLCFNMI